VDLEPPEELSLLFPRCPPDVRSVQQVLAVRKKLVSGSPSWKRKPNHSAVLHYRSALEINGVSPQNLFLDATWRATDGVRPDRFCLSILWCDQRVYAWDVDRAQAHRNQVGVGRPLYQHRIVGHHEHTWSDDGYGYVELLTLNSEDACDVWDLFLVHAGIYPERCTHPISSGGTLDLGIV
jgi:hypothetical protein